MGYIYIFITVLLTVYGQLILKWRMDQLNFNAEGIVANIIMLLKALLDPYVFSSFLSAFFASLAWMAALKEFELSKAYPFMNLSLVFVVLLSFFLFKESLSVFKVIGCALIISGVLFISKG